MVKGVTYTQQHLFAPRTTLIIPHAATLAVALGVCIIGLNALRQNGVSASTGGFLQILCTTTGSPTLDHMAVKGSIGGPQNTPKELQKLEFMFGQLSGKNGPIAGFLIPAEVTPLVRRGNARI
jgi:hypothetical protein